MRGYELLVPLAMADRQREAAEERVAQQRISKSQPMLQRLFRKIGGRTRAA